MAWFYIILASSVAFGWIIGSTIFIRRNNTPKRVMIYGAIIGAVVGIVWGGFYVSHHKEPNPQQVLNVSPSIQSTSKR